MPRPVVVDGRPDPAPEPDKARPPAAASRSWPRAGATGEPVPVAPMPSALRWLGHNKGPPWDTGVHWRTFAWKKANAAAWKTPPIEVVRRRMARARELGMTYEAYTAVLLDTGKHL